MDKPVTPRGVNHLVLNVRDIEESHRFWTEVVGFNQVGQLTPTKDRPNPPKMRFYSGVREDGTSHHHDVALVENRDLPKPPENWSMFGMPCAVNHIAITMPSREAWLEHLEYLQKKGVKFDRRVEHGMTHSLYIHDPNGYGVEFVYDLAQGGLEGRHQRRAELREDPADRRALRPSTTAPRAFRSSRRRRRRSRDCVLPHHFLSPRGEGAEKRVRGATRPHQLGYPPHRRLDGCDVAL